MTDEHGHGSVAYEKTDVDAGAVVRAGAIVFGVSTLTALLLIGYLAFLTRQADRHEPRARALAYEGGREAPQPRLQTQPFEDVHALRAAEERVLHGYAWVDKPAGIVRIPIDDAMRLYVARIPSPPAKEARPEAGAGGAW